MKTEIERYIPKELQSISSTAVPLHPEIELTISKLTKDNEELRTKLTEAEARLDKLKDKEDRIKYLEKFVEYFVLHCISDSADITILRCSKILSMGFCSMKKICKPRLALGEKLSYL